MGDITNNEMRFVLEIFKNSEEEYNASTMAKKMGITPMGSLKIARRLVNENILDSKELGKAKFYTLNWKNDYTREYIKFLLKREAEQAHHSVKRWIQELKKIKSADCAILYGSLLTKYDKARDIDVLFITNQRRFEKLKKEINEINEINLKKVHPMFQTRDDIKNNIKEKSPALFQAIKGVVVFGENVLVEILKK